jgi:hypothetical protein
MAELRDWKLVAPWYRWKQQGGDPRETIDPTAPAKPSAARPAIQKFETADFVNGFLKDPQRSLKFNDDDLVTVYEQVARINNDFFTAAAYPGGVLPKLVAPKPKTPPNPPLDPKFPPPESIAKPGTVRKLFLDSHKRHYLVVCELHCDAPGFPTTTRDQVCEVGFVVRRRRTAMTPAQAKEAANILKDIDKAALELQVASASDKLQKLEQDYQAELDKKKGISKQQLFKEAVHSPLRKAKAAALQTIAAAQAKLKVWKAGVSPILEGWVPSGFDKIGSWQSVEEEPEVVTEQIFPMYPLIPDERQKDHAAAGRNLYFGIIPTGSADTTDDGTARFDPGSKYEIRCFVRRHKEPCPKKPGRNDCPGPLVWSAPTEPYQLAAHFDLIGTSQRPVTMQMPNIPELAAQAASLPPAKIAPFKMASPNPQSNLGFKLQTEDDPKTAKADPPGGIPEICSFAIPLITIVATFVLKLFLPIVVLVFGLFFLLKLKFCIPPSISIDAKVEAALKVDLPSIDIDVGLSVQVGGQALVDLKASLGLPDTATQADVLAKIKADLQLPAAATDLDITGKIHGSVVSDLNAKVGPKVTAELAATYSNEALVKFEADLGTEPSAADLSLTASLEFEPPVLQAEVSIS